MPLRLTTDLNNGEYTIYPKYYPLLETIKVPK